MNRENEKLQDDIGDMENQLESLDMQFLEEEAIIQEQIQRLEAQMTHLIIDVGQQEGEDGMYPDEENEMTDVRGMPLTPPQDNSNLFFNQAHVVLRDQEFH